MGLRVLCAVHTKQMRPLVDGQPPGLKARTNLDVEIGRYTVWRPLVRLGHRNHVTVGVRVNPALVPNNDGRIYNPRM